MVPRPYVRPGQDMDPRPRARPCHDMVYVAPCQGIVLMPVIVKIYFLGISTFIFQILSMGPRRVPRQHQKT